MKMLAQSRAWRLAFFTAVAVTIALSVNSAAAEKCLTSQEIDAATRTSLQTAAVFYFQSAAQGNSQALLQNSIPEIAGNAQAMESLLQEHKANLAGAEATPRNTFILDTGGTTPLEHADFYCGVFNSPLKVGFNLNNLAPGKYGLVVLDVTNSKTPYFYTFILKQDASGWKIAGLFPKMREIAGHDSQWYWQQARNYKDKGQRMNAWFHYLAARELAVPVAFMSTAKLETFNDEMQQAQPPEFPGERPLALTAPGGKTYQVTNLFVVPNDKEQKLDLVMRYQASDVSDPAKTFLENKDAMKALLSRYPELQEPFGNLVARAVAPNGRDFGTMLPMREVR